MTIALSYPGAPAPTVTLSEGDAGPMIEGLAVPLGVPSGPSGDGRCYLFEGPPSNADELVDVVREHDPDVLVGRLAGPWETGNHGLTARARIYETTAGRDVLVEAREGARASFSVGAAIERFTERQDGVRVVTAWRAQHLGVVRRPAFSAATGLTIRASAAPETTTTAHREEPHMPPAQNPEPPVKDLPTVAELSAQLAPAVAELLHDRHETHPLSAFSSFEAFLSAFQEAGQDRQREMMAAFAVPDQITTQNPGVMPPGWRTEIKLNLDARTPAITAFGRIGLPEAGMDSSWPYFDGSLDGIIQDQTAEKTELSGVRVDIQKATEPIRTAGAISDISYQLIMRSSPSYLQAYLRILMAAWARFTEKRFEEKLLEAGTAAGGAVPDPTKAQNVRAWLFDQSAEVEDATGEPASIALVDSLTWTTLGGAPDLYSDRYGTQNAEGTADASKLRINISGLEIRRAAFFPPATMLVGAPSAAKFPTTGPMVATEEDVRRLGRDVAIWGMYERGEVYFPQGIRVSTAGA